MNVLLQQLHKIVPAFNVASVPKDATGAYASPVHIIAGLLDKTPTYIQKIICGICANVNANCTKMKVVVNGTEQRNRIMVGDAESILRVLASCNRQEMAAIVAKLPVVAQASQAPFVAPTPQALFVAPASQAPFVAEAPQALFVAPTPQAPFVAEAPQVSVAPTPQAPFVAEAPQVSVEPEPAHLQQIKKPLVLNGMVIEVDPVTSMVNATQMCLAGGKLFGDYYRQKSTEEYLQTLSSSMGIHIFDLVRTKPGHNGGTMVHFQVALHVAYWLSSEVQVQFSKWIGELLLTGRVELGKEKTPEELDAIWKSRIAEEQAKIQADYLREKLSKELLAIDEDRVAKRQRDDYDNAKRQREDAAADEERVAKRQRDDAAAAVAAEEEKKDRAAKRQRKDTAVDDKTKEEIRMQLVRFNAETAAKAIAAEEEKEAKRKRDDAAFEEDMRVKKEKGALELANFKKKEELNYNKLLVPFVEDIQNRTNDAHVKALCKDIGMALLNQAKFLISGDSSAPQETKFCDDVTTIGRKLGFDRIFVEKHRSALGKAVAKEYRQRNDGSDPPSTEKYVNGGNRPVCTYDDKDSEWIEDVVRQYLTKQMPAPVVPQLPRAPLRTINNYFTQ